MPESVAVPDRDFFLVCGNQGFGKSVWLKAYIARCNRLFVFCPKASYPNTDFKTDPSEWVKGLIEDEKWNPGKSKFRFGTMYPDEVESHAWSAMAVQKCNVVWDECALLFQARQELPDWAKPLIFMGREPQINLAVAAQRAANVPIAIRSQVDRIVSFRQTEPDDIKVLRERMGEIADDIPGLNKLECLDWRPSGEVKRYYLTP